MTEDSDRAQRRREMEERKKMGDGKVRDGLW